jgi:pilus assembly protein Flp/PilA
MICNEGDVSMLKLIALKNSYVKNEEGATAIEYGLIAAGISLAIAGAVFVFGGDLSALFEGFSGSLGGGESE